MEEKDLQLIKDIAANSKTHAEWLVLMNFGKAELLNNPQLLLALINDEIVRRAADEPVVTSLLTIMGELGLRFIIENN